MSTIMHILLLGVLLGIGASIPIGPVNLEIIRRNLRYGISYGTLTGLGACAADVVYLALLCIGAMSLLHYPSVMRCMGIAGSIILAWFAIKAFNAKTPVLKEDKTSPSLLLFLIEGFIITLINPYTILFWSSVSSQVSLLAASGTQVIWIVGAGVIIGTVGWVLILNNILHFTRQHLTERIITRLNHTGGIILLCFSLLGIYRVFQM
jgi:L-lysine exporter family protein LysE/ArgO